MNEPQCGSFFLHNSTKLSKIRTCLYTEFDRLFILFMVILAYSIYCLINVVERRSGYQIQRMNAMKNKLPFGGNKYVENRK